MATVRPWHLPEVPLGEGMDDLPLFASILKGINFSGPMEIQAEYATGGGGSSACIIAHHERVIESFSVTPALLPTLGHRSA